MGRITKWLLDFLPSCSAVLQGKEEQRNICFLCPPPSRLHADGPTQPHDLSIDEWVLDEGLNQMSILSRVTQVAGEGHLAGQEVAHFSGRLVSSRVPNRPGAVAITGNPRGARCRAVGSVMPTVTPLEAE